MPDIVRTLIVAALLAVIVGIIFQVTVGYGGPAALVTFALVTLTGFRSGGV